MKIEKFETWWVKRDKCLFDEKRRGSGAMDWDVIVIRLTTDTGIEGLATALAMSPKAISTTTLPRWSWAGIPMIVKRYGMISGTLTGT